MPDSPSPKSHEYDAIVVPGALVDADPLKNTVWPVVGDVGENEKAAVGFTGVVTVTVCVVVPVRPLLSVTVKRTTNVPALAYVLVVETPVPMVPSPKSHAYEVIVVADALVDPDPLTATAWPTAGEAGEKLRLAVGPATAVIVTACVVVPV